jgi:hypothetical protein
MVVLGAVVIAISIFLLAKDAEMRDAGGPGIVGWEFAWDEEGATEILEDWGEEGTDAARVSLYVDFAYLLGYGAFFVLAAMATRDLAAERGWTRLAGLGTAAVVCAAAAPAFDAVENVWLLIALEGEGGDAAPLLGSLFACAKFASLAAALAYIAAGLVLRARHRPPAPA